MERNTFATSTYIAAAPNRIYEYLADLGNLDEWTLFSKMQERIDETTWLGTASGFQRPLFYHLQRSDAGPIRSIQWHCGFELGSYGQVYPVLIVPPAYAEHDSDEGGAYVHWISFVAPSRRSSMIDQGIGAVHTAECRSLKAVLERGAGLDKAARGRMRVESETIFVDAPIETGRDYVADLRNMTEYGFVLKPSGQPGATEGEFVDRYGRQVLMRSRTHAMANAYFIEHELAYPNNGGIVLRTPTLLMSCATAFGDAGARGFLKHRMAFWPEDRRPWPGPSGIEEYQAESINLKRILEAKVGNRDSFARGPSYLP